LIGKCIEPGARFLQKLSNRRFYIGRLNPVERNVKSGRKQGVCLIGAGHIMRVAFTTGTGLLYTSRSLLYILEVVKTLPFLAGIMAMMGAAQAQSLSGDALIESLRRGGYVIAMRHASSPRETPGAKTANPDNLKKERQLDEEGRATAAAMGKALRQLRIPIGEILSSPTYRALETIRLAGLGNPKTVAELGDGGQNMQAASDAQAVWLRNQVKQFPVGANTLIITHFPNLSRAFPQWTNGLADGEALIFGPDGKGGATLVARVQIGEWPKMVH
jgi:phosphohistidine phosphatase SixA